MFSLQTKYIEWYTVTGKPLSTLTLNSHYPPSTFLIKPNHRLLTVNIFSSQACLNDLLLFTIFLLFLLCFRQSVMLLSVSPVIDFPICLLSTVSVTGEGWIKIKRDTELSKFRFRTHNLLEILYISCLSLFNLQLINVIYT